MKKMKPLQLPQPDLIEPVEPELQMAPDPPTQWVTVTPEMARQWLEKNVKNRHLNTAAVAHYARQMKEGQWKQVGDPIRFSVAGILIDGQHRLHALVEAGVDLRLLIIGELPPDFQAVIDTGKNRQTKEFFEMEQIPHATILPAIIRQWDFLERANPGERTISKKMKLTTKEVLEHYKANPELVEIARRLNRWGFPIASVWGGVMMHLLLRGITMEQIEAFFQPISDGIVTAGSPGLALRRRVEMHSKKTRRLTDRELSALIIKAWNAHVQGRTVVAIIWRDDESFPKAIIAKEESNGEA